MGPFLLLKRCQREGEPGWVSCCRPCFRYTRADLSRHQERQGQLSTHFGNVPSPSCGCFLAGKKQVPGINLLQNPCPVLASRGHDEHRQSLPECRERPQEGSLRHVGKAGGGGLLRWQAGGSPPAPPNHRASLGLNDTTSLSVLSQHQQGRSQESWRRTEGLEGRSRGWTTSQHHVEMSVTTERTAGAFPQVRSQDQPPLLLSDSKWP